ncbi:rhomboid family intramembrane serine protease [Capillimicrobium parvum]|uniref:Rhomboid protease GlpG n=1 Tax=Capillimicrobium parvum TaxID=2884022 RepID=A0A9E7C1V5_9ACTN|nr:rhomboid family intramembrane serine protease [Capillimicrobium parvum]UGS37890.1 Rhomboid protease GlpG [Capillimicrobium parvum]
MTPTPVGMRCPECASQKTKVRTAANVRAAGQHAPVTKALIAVCVLVYLAEIASGTGGLNGVGNGTITENGALIGHFRFTDIGVAHGDYWRLITGGFLHASIFHILFNMYLLWILGQMLEPAIGSVRFGIVYFTSLLAGSFGALLLEPEALTVGASGAIFGLMGFAFVEMRSRGIDPFQTFIGWLIIINLVLGFVLNNVSIGGHVGGLIGGALAGFAFQYADRRRQSSLGYAGCAVIAVGSIAAAIAVAGGAGLGSPHI